MGSSRLPGKVLKKAGGKSLLDWHFERLLTCDQPVILATTTSPHDTPLCDWADSNGISCFRGSENNVLSRYLDCAKEYNLDIIVRVTSDCPLVDGQMIADGIERYFSHNEPRQYLTNSQSTFPRGFDFEIFSLDLLEEAFVNSKNTYELEHVTPYFYHKKKLDIMVTQYQSMEDNSHLRVTVDTPEDFELVRILIEQHNAGISTHFEITELLKKRPDLVALNQHVVQKRVA